MNASLPSRFLCATAAAAGLICPCAGAAADLDWSLSPVEHEPIAFGFAPECFRPSADNPRKCALIEGMQGK